jgi:hypothetical protein
MAQVAFGRADDRTRRRRLYDTADVRPALWRAAQGRAATCSV